MVTRLERTVSQPWKQEKGFSEDRTVELVSALLLASVGFLLILGISCLEDVLLCPRPSSVVCVRLDICPGLMLSPHFPCLEGN